MRSQTSITSAFSAKYLQVLCRHFARKVNVELDENRGVVTFSMGVTIFELINGQLTISCQSSQIDSLNLMQKVVTDHVMMFTKRERIELIWEEIKQ